MDLNEFFIAVLIILLILLFAAIIYNYGMSGKTFEEVMAEQQHDRLTLISDKPRLEPKKDRKWKTTFRRRGGEKSGGSLTEDGSDVASMDEEPGAQMRTTPGKARKGGMKSEKQEQLRQEAKQKEQEAKVREQEMKQREQQEVKQREQETRLREQAVKRREQEAKQREQEAKQREQEAKQKEEEVKQREQQEARQQEIKQKERPRSTDTGPANPVEGAMEELQKEKSKEVHAGVHERLVAAPLGESAPPAAELRAPRREEEGKVGGTELSSKKNKKKVEAATGLEQRSSE